MRVVSAFIWQGYDQLGQNSFWHRTILDRNFLPAAAIESKTVAASTPHHVHYSFDLNKLDAQTQSEIFL